MNPYSYSMFPAGFLAAYGVVWLLLAALLLASMWRIFVKMGEPGWKGIIPVYSVWVLIGRLRKPRSWFWILVGGVVVLMLLSAVITAAQIASGGTYSGGALNLVVLAVALVMLIYQIRLYHALSKAFGRGAGYTVGLVLLSFVFLPMLAFGPDKFQPAE